MLNELKLERFKSWREAKVHFAPLTAFFGANSFGKSSLIQFLLLLKQTKDSVDRSLALDFGGPESLVDLGSFRDAVYSHDEGESINWEMSWKLPSELRISDPSGKRAEAIFRGNDIAVSSVVRLRSGIAVGDFLAYEFSDSRFSLERGRNGFQVAYCVVPGTRCGRHLGQRNKPL